MTVTGRCKATTIILKNYILEILTKEGLQKR